MHSRALIFFKGKFTKIDEEMRVTEFDIAKLKGVTYYIVLDGYIKKREVNSLINSFAKNIIGAIVLFADENEVQKEYKINIFEDSYNQAYIDIKSYVESHNWNLKKLYIFSRETFDGFLDYDNDFLIDKDLNGYYYIPIRKLTQQVTFDELIEYYSLILYWSDETGMLTINGRAMKEGLK